LLIKDSGVSMTVTAGADYQYNFSITYIRA
jgi:hypothetical protein